MQTSILWHLDTPLSTEQCTFTTGTDAQQINGAVVHDVAGRPCQTHYNILIDSNWHTRDVSLRMAFVDEKRELRLAADGDGNWWLNDAEYPLAQGCIDIDLGITPATNTLPIRRLRLQPGQSEEVTALWVRFPELTVELLPQRYTCLAPDRHQYQSATFAAVLQVNEQGIVLSYENAWQAKALATH
jgi:uncharacterized protein